MLSAGLFCCILWVDIYLSYISPSCVAMKPFSIQSKRHNPKPLSPPLSLDTSHHSSCSTFHGFQQACLRISGWWKISHFLLSSPHICHLQFASRRGRKKQANSYFVFWILDKGQPQLRGRAIFNRYLYRYSRLSNCNVYGVWRGRRAAKHRKWQIAPALDGCVGSPSSERVQLNVLSNRMLESLKSGTKVRREINI